MCEYMCIHKYTYNIQICTYISWHRDTYVSMNIYIYIYTCIYRDIHKLVYAFWDASMLRLVSDSALPMYSPWCPHKQLVLGMAKSMI